jgi:hypothetical protein
MPRPWDARTRSIANSRAGEATTNQIHHPSRRSLPPFRPAHDRKSNEQGEHQQHSRGGFLPSLDARLVVDRHLAPIRAAARNSFRADVAETDVTPAET